MPCAKSVALATFSKFIINITEPAPLLRLFFLQTIAFCTESLSRSFVVTLYKVKFSPVVFVPKLEFNMGMPCVGTLLLAPPLPVRLATS